MDIITTSMQTTIAGIASGSILPIGNILEKKGIEAENNRIITGKGTFYCNAVFNVNHKAKIVAFNDKDRICSAEGCGIVPIAFTCNSGTIYFVVECDEPITLHNVSISIFSKHNPCYNVWYYPM